MEVYLVRHGEAGPAEAGSGDAGRRLTRRGESAVAGVALGLRALGVRLDSVWTSPLRRARETAALLARGLPGPEPEPRPFLDGSAAASAVLAEIAGAGERLALVGHQPVLGELVVLAVAGVVSGGARLGTGSVACLDFDGRPRAGHGSLRWLLTADQLARLGGAG